MDAVASATQGVRRSGIISARRRTARRRWAILAIIALIAATAAVLADQLAGLWQQKLLEDKRAARAQLERMVLHYLRADVVDVVHTPDGRYEVTLFLENVYPEYDMHVMVPQVRTFAQSGPMWREVPTEEPKDTLWRSGSVVHLTKRITFTRIFDVPKGDWFQLLPGFFHVRFDNTMLVSPLAQPKDNVMERADNYYVHLLPIGTDLADIRRKNQFPGDQVPIYLPMPPH